MKYSTVEIRAQLSVIEKNEIFQQPKRKHEPLFYLKKNLQIFLKEKFAYAPFDMKRDLTELKKITFELIIMKKIQISIKIFLMLMKTKLPYYQNNKSLILKRRCTL